MMKNISIFLCLLLLFSQLLYAAFDRKLDAVIIKGQNCPAFLGRSIEGLRFYSYNATKKTWSPIPFQVDFLDSNGYVWQTQRFILGEYDEIVFMAKDAGNKAGDASIWPSDANSKLADRYEIALADKSTSDSAFVYIYYSFTLNKSNGAYVMYRNDRVYGETYGMAHHPTPASGLPDSLAINGNNVDFLDSWRVRAAIKKIVLPVEGLGDLTGENIYFSERMSGSFQLKLGFISVTVNAQAFQEGTPLYKMGPIRVVRNNTIAVRFWTTGLEDTSRIPFTITYYRNFVEFKPKFSLSMGDVKTLESYHVAFSQAFNSNAMNMKFFGTNFVLPDGRQDSLIDKNPLGEDKRFQRNLSADDWPGIHWMGFSGQPSSSVNNASLLTFVTLAGERLAPVRDPALYYWDFKQDVYDPAGKYGVNGLMIFDWSSPPYERFDIDAKIKTFYFNKNSTRSEFQALFDKYKQPIAVSLLEQTYVEPPDTIAPARIADLEIETRTDTSMTLVWTAPGDDGTTGGPVQYYNMRYNTKPPTDFDGPDWRWWEDSVPNAVANLPAPATPGTLQSVTVKGLSAANVYYFRMNARDDAGNVSAISNTAFSNTTPVELASFTATGVNEKDVLISWITESESNNLGFTLQRKSKENTLWEDIIFIRGAGTSSKENFYKYTDSNLKPGDWLYRLKQQDMDGFFAFSKTITASVSFPEKFTLFQNYPNPFNPTTRIDFQIPEDVNGEMVLAVYDMLGRKVRVLVQQKAKPGYYDVQWDGRDDFGVRASSGIYIYRLSAGHLSSAKKMIKIQ